jgi:5'-3' exonuclease
MSDRLFLLVDGHNFFIRSYVVNPALDTNGERIGGTLGMLQGIRKLADRFKPTAIIVVWDGEGGAAKRRSIRAEYKEGRRVRLNRGREGDADFSTSAEEDRANMDRQIQLAHKYIEMLGVQQLRVPGIEADDAISILTRTLEGRKVIVSTDRDYLQLVTSEISVYNPVKEKTFDEKVTETEVGCLPANYVLFKAVCGDKGDNVAGVKGIGIKTLVKIVPRMGQEPMDLNQLLEDLRQYNGTKATMKTAQEILAAEPLIRENMQLVSLHDPPVDAGAHRSCRSMATTRPEYKAFGIRLHALKDGLQLKDDFDKPFMMLSIRSNSWLKDRENDKNVDE